MNDNTGYNVFLGLLQKSSSILIDFLDKIYNMKQQINDSNNDIDLSNFKDEDILLFKDFLSKGGQLNGINLGSNEAEVLCYAINEFENDSKSMSKTELAEKYGLNEDENFAIPLIAFSNNDKNTIFLIRNTDVKNLTKLAEYISEHQEYYKNIVFKDNENVGELFKDYFEENIDKKILNNL